MPLSMLRYNNHCISFCYFTSSLISHSLQLYLFEKKTFVFTKHLLGIKLRRFQSSYFEETFLSFKENPQCVFG